MSFFPSSLETLIDKFASLPGIGRKSAQRLAFHVLGLPDAEAEAKFFDEVSALVADEDKKKAFAVNISQLAVKNSADLIAKEIVQMVK